MRLGRYRLGKDHVDRHEDSCQLTHFDRPRADFDFGFSRCREALLTGGSVALGAVAARVQLLTDRRDCPNG
jgi:hypothetical protein